MHSRLARLQAYPFERLTELTRHIRPPEAKNRISLTIGEPQHPIPACILDALRQHLVDFSHYPATRGLPTLREAIAGWLTRRFALDPNGLDPERHVLPVAGTREALFSIAQTVVDDTQPARVAMPDPCYQIYEGATLLAGAEPLYLPTDPVSGLPAFDGVPDDTWRQCQLLYLCTPDNPTGRVMPLETLMRVIKRAHEFDFLIASDECYSEIYPDEDNPPPGLLQAAESMGLDDFSRCLAFHSLSKRSNAPGLRSGFVAGDGRVLTDYLRYRTYHGATQPLPVQYAGIAAWNDETHVRENRAFYRKKFEAVLDILGERFMPPDGGFYLWPDLGMDDQTFTRELLQRENVLVLPGSYLGRDIDGHNPAYGHVRISLVVSLDECMEAARRIRRTLDAL